MRQSTVSRSKLADYSVRLVTASGWPLLSALAMTNRRGLAMTKWKLLSREPADQFCKGPGPMTDLCFFIQ